ncbi:hypothetical protein BH09ACT1_BH09ACT1_16980 [soil metagenome]
MAHRVSTLAVGAVATLGLIIGAAVVAEPAQAFTTFDTEGQSSFGGFKDPLNIDVCWKTTLSPIWVEATRRATAAWNAATPSLHFRSLRAVAAREQNCDVYIYDTLDFDTSHDGVISRTEGNVRAQGGRSARTARVGSKTVWYTDEGFVKINTRSPYMQGRGARDLNSFQSTMVHELGHVLGLKHTQPSNYSRSIMSTSTNSFIVPQSDDIAGINYIYKKLAVVPAARSNLVTSAPLTSMIRPYWLPAGSSAPDATKPDPTKPDATKPDVPMPIDGETNGTDAEKAPVAAAPAPAPAVPVVPAPAKPAPAVPAPAAPAPPVATPSIPAAPAPVPTKPVPGSTPKADSSTRADEAPPTADSSRPAASSALPIVPTLILVVLALLLVIGVILVVRWRRFVTAASGRGGGHRD